MEKEPIFTRQISTGTRVYYLDVHVDRKGQRYVSVSEIPTDRTPARKPRQRIFIHAEMMEKFSKAFDQVASFLREESRQGNT